VQINFRSYNYFPVIYYHLCLFLKISSKARRKKGRLQLREQWGTRLDEVVDTKWREDGSRGKSKQVRGQK
jgi:hypothetical protein